MHYLSSFYSPAYAPSEFGYFALLAPFFIIIMLWTIVLKGFALWHAARASQKWWFVALLVINTLGILELVYLVWFRSTSISEAPAVHSSTQE